MRSVGRHKSVRNTRARGTAALTADCNLCEELPSDNDYSLIISGKLVMNGHTTQDWPLSSFCLYSCLSLSLPNSSFLSRQDPPICTRNQMSYDAAPASPNCERLEYGGWQ